MPPGVLPEPRYAPHGPVRPCGPFLAPARHGSQLLTYLIDSKNLGRSAMIVYDRYPGGLGYAEKGFHQIGELLRICLEMVSQCPCEDGCPSCVGLPNLRPAIHSDPDLMRGYPIPEKRATLRLLELLRSKGERFHDDTLKLSAHSQSTS